MHSLRVIFATLSVQLPAIISFNSPFRYDFPVRFFVREGCSFIPDYVWLPRAVNKSFGLGQQQRRSKVVLIGTSFF